jgi:hypothetical protein
MKRRQRRNRRQHEEELRLDGRRPPDTPKPRLLSLKTRSPQAGAFPWESVERVRIGAFRVELGIILQALHYCW